MTNIPEEDKAHSRFHSWAALAILSIVAVLAITQNPNNATNFEENWSLGCVFASLAVAAIACICHGIRKSRDAFVGSIVEAILIVIAVIVWIMALPIIMSPNRSLAINNLNIVDANLYFSAWGCIALALYIAGSWIEERGYHPYADRLAKRWFLLFVSSIVAMGVSSRIFSINNCRDSGNEICDELSLAIGIAVWAAILGFAMTLFMHFLSGKNCANVFGLMAAVIATALWSVGLAYITYDGGPGNTVGNLFFSTWVSFVLSIYLLLSHTKTLLFGTSHSPTETGGGNKTSNDVRNDERV
jgi:hypothetical protein